MACGCNDLWVVSTVENTLGLQDVEGAIQAPGFTHSQATTGPHSLSRVSSWVYKSNVDPTVP